ncbi:MAG: diguanylate cyclase [Sulfuriferula sp.]|nr:diguanylate cyclase [Sulfuriferula sp.]
MPFASEKTRLLGRLSLILVVGFLTTSIASYLVSRNSIRSNIAEQALPLTADNVYSEIQRDILQPVVVSSLMAQDTFLRDWLLHGERDTAQIERYLQEIRLKYGAVSSFLVSERTRRYYYGGGILKVVQQDNPVDKWYFRVRALNAPYETNVDYDLANRNTMTVFINYRVVDYNGRFLGATGIGLTLDAVSRLIDKYQQQFRRRIYFVDPQGTIVLAGKSMRDTRGSILNQPGIDEIAGQILNRTKVPSSLEYQRDGSMVLVNSRFIPELGWYLVVEQDEREAMRPINQVFLLNLTVSIAISLLVVTITLFAVNRYQRRLERLATIDALTGFLNRQAFESVFGKMIAQAARARQPFSAILFDIDLFKRINDTYGHLKGDEVIRTIAKLAAANVRAGDVIARWGGEEFFVMLPNCTQQQAVRVAEQLRHAISTYDFTLDQSSQPITVSAGAAQYGSEETTDAFFARVDQALYQAKAQGRNVTVAV